MTDITTSNKYLSALVKTAALPADRVAAAPKPTTTLRQIAKGTALRVGLPLAVMGVAAGASEILKLRDRMNTQDQFNRSLATAVTQNNILANSNKKAVKEFAQTVYSLAPHAAGDPNVLASVLANAIHGEGFDPRTARDLLDLEEKFLKVRSLGDPDLVNLGKLVAVNASLAPMVM
jgi:hypothetical protein